MILVTGGNGLVGSCYSEFNRYPVTLAGREDADLTDFDQTLKMFEKYKPSYVIHCAAKVGGIKGNMDYGADFARDNLRINTNVFEACRITGVKKIVNFGSTCIFPDRATYPLSVDQIFKGEPHPSNAPYAYAKRMAIVQLKAYKKQYGLDSVTVIPCNMYGENDNYSIDGHVIPSLIKKCVKAKESNAPFTIWGDGTPLREFLYAKDVARVAYEALRYYDSDEPLIISNGIEHSIMDVAKEIAKIVGYEDEIMTDTASPNGQHRKPSDHKPCKLFVEEKIHNFKFTTLSTGLKWTIKHYMENKNG